LKWILLLLWNPVKALDLCDNKGSPDHGKIIGWIMAWAVLISLLITSGKVPSLGHTIALLAAAQGTRVFVAFLKYKTVTAHEDRGDAAVRARRQGEDFEPWP
jgi:hypothetical protein